MVYQRGSDHKSGEDERQLDRFNRLANQEKRKEDKIRKIYKGKISRNLNDISTNLFSRIMQDDDFIKTYLGGPDHTKIGIPPSNEQKKLQRHFIYHLIKKYADICPIDKHLTKGLGLKRKRIRQTETEYYESIKYDLQPRLQEKFSHIVEGIVYIEMLRHLVHDLSIDPNHVKLITPTYPETDIYCIIKDPEDKNDPGLAIHCLDGNTQYKKYSTIQTIPFKMSAKDMLTGTTLLRKKLTDISFLKEQRGFMKAKRHHALHPGVKTMNIIDTYKTKYTDETHIFSSKEYKGILPEDTKKQFLETVASKKAA